jgi:very-short-patch-repair endonuclease
MSSHDRGMDRMFRSPIEEKFYFAARDRIPDLVPQFSASTSSRDYSLDFAKVITDKKTGRRVLKVAIELDGYDYHSSKEQRNHDSQRDRQLMAEGWMVIHFTGSQINKNVNRCVEETADLIELWARDRGVAAELGPRRRAGDVCSPEGTPEASRMSILRIAVAAIAVIMLMAIAAIAVANGWLNLRVP